MKYYFYSKFKLDKFAFKCWDAVSYKNAVKSQLSFFLQYGRERESKVSLKEDTALLEFWHIMK